MVGMGLFKDRQWQVKKGAVKKACVLSTANPNPERMRPPTYSPGSQCWEGDWGGRRWSQPFRVTAWPRWSRCKKSLAEWAGGYANPVLFMIAVVWVGGGARQQTGTHVCWDDSQKKG